MTEHDEIRGQLPGYCGGDLTAPERVRLEAHLSSCPDCRQELADLETTMGLLRSQPEVEPPPWLAGRIMARVREEAEIRPRSWLQRLFLPLRLKLPLEALAIVIVCVVSYFLVRDSGQQMLPPQVPPPAASAPAAGSQPAPPQREPQPPVAPPLPASRQTAPAPPAAPAATSRPAGEGYVPAPPRPVAAPAPLPAPRLEDSAPAARAKDAVSGSPTPVLESAPRLQKGAPEGTKARSLEGGAVRSEADSQLAAPAAPAPPLQLRLVVADPEGADLAIRRAVALSGGTVTGQAASRQLSIRIPVQGLPPLFRQLAAIGRITERPALESLAGSVELTVRW